MKKWFLLVALVLLAGCDGIIQRTPVYVPVQPTPVQSAPQTIQQSQPAPASPQQINVQVDCCGNGSNSQQYTPHSNDNLPPSQPATCPSQIPAGSTAFISPGCVVLGDVAYGGQILYDDGGTGQATVVVVTGSQGVYITAPWGAGVKPAITGDFATIAQHYVAAEMQTGCGGINRCRQVRVVIIQNGSIVFHQIY